MSQPFKQTYSKPTGSYGAKPYVKNTSAPKPYVKPSGTSAPKPFVAGASTGVKPQGGYDRKNFMVYLNEQIKAPTIIIVNEDGSVAGTYPRKVALDMAEEQGLDLVQIRYDQEKMVSTVKMVDYGKYNYQKQKEEKEKKKTQKPNVVKEVKIGYTIGDNDLLLKIKKAREMLQDGYHVRFFIKLKGREKIYFAKAIEKLQFVKANLLDAGRPQFDQPKQEIQGYSMVLFSK